MLVNSQGQTLYWFAIDTPTKSNCSGTCATYWPPVLGKVTAASGTTLPKGFGTIKRSDGKLQATYDGHPLYTYAADTSAGHDERQRHEPVGRPVVGDDAIGRQAGGEQPRAQQQQQRWRRLRLLTRRSQACCLGSAGPEGLAGPGNPERASQGLNQPQALAGASGPQTGVAAGRQDRGEPRGSARRRRRRGPELLPHGGREGDPARGGARVPARWRADRLILAGDLAAVAVLAGGGRAGHNCWMTDSRTADQTAARRTGPAAGC